MRTLRCFALLIVLNASSLFSFAQSPPQTTPAAFSIALTGSQTTAKAGSELLLRAEFTNTSKKDLFLTIAGNAAEFNFAIKVLDDSGKEPRETRYFRAVRGKDASDDIGKTTLVVTPSYGIRQVKSGDTFTNFLYLKALFDFQPGTYTVQVQRFDEESQTTVKSNMLKVIFTP